MRQIAYTLIAGYFGIVSIGFATLAALSFGALFSAFGGYQIP
jgi:ABC-type Co2+ transport system permease subunit